MADHSLALGSPSGRCYNLQWEHIPDKSRPELLYSLEANGEGNPAGVDQWLFRKDLENPLDPTNHPLYNQWEWVPRDPECPMVDWNVSLFCDLLGVMNVSRIMIVGDSISHQMAQSLSALVKGSGNPTQFT